MKALLDTHILLWWHGNRGRLSREQRDFMAAAGADSPLEVSDISLWEVAMLYSSGRIRLTIPLREWLDKAVAAPLVRRHGISPAVAAELASLLDSFHRDPASRSLRREGRPRLDIDQGIQQIRNLLPTSDNALRMVDLSGVGKTRIVQALFEASVGTDPLDKSLAIYADLGTEVLPTPRQVVGHLKATGHPAFLVLENSPATTHNLLAAEVSDAPDIRLITIEYDIRKDSRGHPSPPRSRR